MADANAKHERRKNAPGGHSDQPEYLFRLMESLADASRLRMLRLLERHELGVAQLAEILQMPQSTISRHLKVLSDQNWLRSRRSGTAHFSKFDEAGLTDPQKRLWQLAREQSSGWLVLRQDESRLRALLESQNDATRKFFTGAAGQWDRLRSQLYGTEFSWRAVAAMLPGDSVVADLGCGTGQLLEAVAPFVKKAVGVDNTPAMLDAARVRLGGFSNVELVESDLEALSLDDSTVDTATMLLALSYVADPEAAAGEMRRILRPGGRAVVVDVTRHDREDFRRELGQSRSGFEPDELKIMLVGAGFRQVNVTPIPPEPTAKGPPLLLALAVRPD